jgi:hypothetical protein
MTIRKDQPDPIDDIEKPHPLVVEGTGDAAPTPLTVRLSDPWSDFLRATDEPPRSAPGLPLLDDMKGILQWD